MQNICTVYKDLQVKSHFSFKLTFLQILLPFDMFSRIMGTHVDAYVNRQIPRQKSYEIYKAILTSGPRKATPAESQRKVNGFRQPSCLFIQQQLSVSRFVTATTYFSCYNSKIFPVLTHCIDNMLHNSLCNVLL